MAKKPTNRLKTWLENLSPEKQQKLRAWTARGILLIVGLSLFVCLCYQGEEYARQLDYFTVDPSHIELAQRPLWLTPDIEEDIFAASCLSRRFSIQEPEITTYVAHGLEQSPWVREVIAVRKRYPNRLAIELELRRPIAYVDYRGTFYAVDRFGVRLPAVSRNLQKAPWRLPCILAGRSEPPAVAEPWEGDVVAHAASVASTIDQAGERFPVTVVAIDVRFKYRNGQADPDVTLYTTEGPHIKWGSPPSMEHHGEPDGATKIDNLATFADRVETLTDREYVDIRFADAVYWRDRTVLAEPVLSASRSIR